MVQPTSERDALAVDYNRCPIPKTHRRLVEAHLLWHQTLGQYQQPELFQANLNATIQALRNITFILQSEKPLFNQFEDWYGPWQERMRADPVLMWLKDARNSIVKEGDLETTSTAIVRLVTWRDDVLMESIIPPDIPSSLIIRNLPLLELVNNTHLPPNDLKSAAIMIERRWSAPGLNGREILEALAQAYGLLSDVVLDAHITLGKTDCVLLRGTHAHFRSAYHRSGTLPCMSLGIEHRTHSFDLETGQKFQTVITASPKVDPEIAAKRYGLGQSDQMPIWKTVDPLLVAEGVLYTAKRILRKDRALIRILFIRDGGGSWHPTVLEASNRTEKNLLMRLVARFIESVGGDAIIDVGEVWMLGLKDTPPKTSIDDIQYAPDREEAVSVLVATREGFLREYITPFTRGPLGGINLGDTVHDEGGYHYYLKPVFGVWRRQGRTYSLNGKRIRRRWEPDPLDTCFCGGPRRFSECCKRLLDTLDQRADIKQEIDKARTTHDFARFEELIRAELAQYVIWVKQHTSPTRHVAPELHRMGVEVDMPALSAHIRRLADALEANEHLDSFLPQLRHISKVIGVPELSIRITSLAVQWLFEMGDYSSAFKEMKTLGDLEHLGDTLALVLATKLIDLPIHKQGQFLTRAVSGALWEDERWLAELELARHLSDCGKQDEAVRKVDSVMAELMEASGHRGLRADAMSLRWYITKEEHDFQIAKNELQTLAGPEHQQRLAVILIDHGDYNEADRILSDALIAGDPVAQLLIIDARLRANQSDSARELLLIIAPDRITPSLQHPYAVAYALVALACGEDGLKKIAAAKLRQLPTIGTRMVLHVNDFLKALEGQENMERKSPMARFSGLFRR